MFVSGIGHVLSISGYHMAVVAGVMFFMIRACLALIPGFAEPRRSRNGPRRPRLPCRRLSGALRQPGRDAALLIMIAVVLVGVWFDRPTVTMRTLTVAALVVLLFAPEAVVIRAFRCRLRQRWR